MNDENELIDEDKLRNENELNNLHEIYEDDKNNLYNQDKDELVLQDFLTNDYDIPEQSQDKSEEVIDED